MVGGYLFDKPRDILYKLARSEDMCERRTAIVATYYFIRQDDTAETFKIAEVLVNDEDDLIHKAVGGWLREAGKRDPDGLLDFLDRFAATMPRTALRYAVEHLDKTQRDHFMAEETVVDKPGTPMRPTERDIPCEKHGCSVPLVDGPSTSWPCVVYVEHNRRIERPSSRSLATSGSPHLLVLSRHVEVPNYAIPFRRRRSPPRPSGPVVKIARTTPPPPPPPPPRSTRTTSSCRGRHRAWRCRSR